MVRRGALAGQEARGRPGAEPQSHGKTTLAAVPSLGHGLYRAGPAGLPYLVQARLQSNPWVGFRLHEPASQLGPLPEEIQPAAVNEQRPAVPRRGAVRHPEFSRAGSNPDVKMNLTGFPAAGGGVYRAPGRWTVDMVT